jgi:glycosyltransferase involved in cell wall biosynthesis
VAAPSLRIAFVAPAYWPAEAFGGPVWVLRSLARELVARGHAVDVWTTTLSTVSGRRTGRSSSAHVDGAHVRYLATPVRYRWMGYTPTLGRELRRAPRPDVAHVFGYRDPIGYLAARRFRRTGVPYAFEALGMFRPKLRKQRLKRALDATVFASLPREAAVVVAASEIERREYLDAGVPAARVALRPNGVPQAPGGRSGELRRALGADTEQLILYVGRIADGKGLELLVRALPRLPGVLLALVGPDDGHGTPGRLRRLASELGVADRVRPLGAWPTQPLSLYADADVFALPSAHENFGMAAAEAASAGVPVVVTDRCGVAEILRDAGALVVPYEQHAVESALGRLLADEALRRTIGAQGAVRAAEYSWPSVAALQEEIYRRVVG